jgi:preprotein translocase subunit YajC
MTFLGIFASPLLAAAAEQPTVQDPRAVGLNALGLPILLAVVFYLILIRPQQKRQKELANVLKTLKSGDKVVTSGGILGVVVSVKDKSLTIRSGDTKLEVLKSAVSEVTEKAEKAAAGATATAS